MVLGAYLRKTIRTYEKKISWGKTTYKKTF